MNYEMLIKTWRKNWKTKSKYLAIGTCSSEKEVIKIAVHKAHAPSVARALTLEAGTSTNGPRKEVAAYLEEEIKNKLYKESFTFEEYDEWAREVCTKIRQIYRNHHIGDYTFGNAQKLFSMSIKYVLSADNIDPKLPIFKVAHVPVDRVLMQISKKKLGVRQMSTAWSKTDDYEEILSYQRRYRASLEEGYTPLAWECENWSN